jgi:superfamily II DNA or RNA helicase
MIISKFKWQKEVVINIAYLITMRKKEIIVALETGHGKTIVI